MKNFKEFKLVSYEETIDFGKNQRNRKINRGNLVKIKKQMLESFDVIPPITVNTITGNIIDGQTRHKAYQELIVDGKLPKETPLKVMFVEIDKEHEIDAIIDANTNSKNWSCDDYFECYVRGDNTSYIKLDYFCKHHSLTFDDIKKKSKFRYAAAMIKGKECQDELKHGTFTVTDEELKHGEKIHSELLDMMEILQLPQKGHWIGPMSISWNRNRKLHNYSEWRKAIKERSKSVRFMKLPKENVNDWDNIFSQLHMYIDNQKEY